MRRYKYILFDCDGTLIDSKPGVIESIEYALQLKGIPYDMSTLDKMIGPPFRVSFKEFFNMTSDQIEESINDYRRVYDSENWKHCRVFDGLYDLLAKLQKDGFKVAVATSKPQNLTEKIVNQFELTKYFDFVGGATLDASRDSKTAVVDYVLKNLGVKDKREVLLIGDTKYDIEGAHQSGIDCLVVTWGYGNMEDFIQYKADKILDNCAQIYNYLING